MGRLRKTDSSAAGEKEDFPEGRGLRARSCSTSRMQARLAGTCLGAGGRVEWTHRKDEEVEVESIHCLIGFVKFNGRSLKTFYERNATIGFLFLKDF